MEYNCGNCGCKFRHEGPDHPDLIDTIINGAYRWICPACQHYYPGLKIVTSKELDTRLIRKDNKNQCTQ